MGEKFLCRFALASAQESFIAEESESQSPYFGLSAFSLGLNRGPLFFTFVEGSKASVTSQIAVKMSLDAIVQAALDSVGPEALFTELSPRHTKVRAATSSDVVKAGFREANRVVYEYGAKMLSGAKITATGVSAAFDGENVTVGRAGEYDSFLWRERKLTRFFDLTEDRSAPQLLERLVGANRKVRVDIASVGTAVGDVILVTTFQANAVWQERVAEFLSTQPLPDELAEYAAQEAARSQESVARALEKNLIVAVFAVDEPLIMLENVVLE